MSTASLVESQIEAETQRLIQTALAEDLSRGDITTDSIFTGAETTTAVMVNRHSTFLSGLQVAKQVFETVDASLQVTLLAEDGASVPTGTELLRVSGSTASILKAERVALNFAQLLSGIAMSTFQFVAAVSQTKAQIAHTRKTVPGLRALSIQAVLHGRGVTHRTDLGDAVLIKDNHIAAAGGVAQAIQQVRAKNGADIFIQVECDSLADVETALTQGAQRVLLDNMDTRTLADAVRLCRGKVITEASGGISLKNVAEIAKTGVDIISTSQITLSPIATDIGLDFIDA